MTEKFTKYYFIGIGGIGMSALARYFNTKGFPVAGFDRTETKITSDLSAEGIKMIFDESVEAIPVEFNNKNKTMVVVTPAIPPTHPQLQHFTAEGFVLKKRSEVLGDLTESNKAICIAGTHGKTTISTMTAHLLHQSHIGCNAFLGGISNNYNTNLLFTNESNFVVIEADEYDRSFHTLSPYMAVISSVDADHLDIYGTHTAFIESFRHFTSLIVSGGVLLMHDKVRFTPQLKKGVKAYHYGINTPTDFYAENVRLKDGYYTFDFVTPTEILADIKLGVPMMINVENSVAAMALAWLNGASHDEIRTAMSNFSGIYRRFNIVFNNDKRIYIDDYAHHPKELIASIKSMRKMYEGRKITAIFQPHLYSRTRDFAPEFGEALSLLDELILLDIYPARELPIAGVTSKVIFDKVEVKRKMMCKKEEVVQHLNYDEIDVLVTFGAGDIEQIVGYIKKYLKGEVQKRKIAEIAEKADENQENE